MWHASIQATATYTKASREAIARRLLEGVGDAQAGEWVEDRPAAYHLRRRLTEAEAARVGPVLDIRGTWEATKRLRAVARWLPQGYVE